VFTRKTQADEQVYYKWLDLASTQDQTKANIQKYRAKYWTRNQALLANTTEPLSSVIEQLKSSHDTDAELNNYDLSFSDKFFFFVDLSHVPTSTQDKQLTKLLKVKCQSKDTRTSMQVLVEMLSKPNVP
jgi:hypothetical protein